MPAGGREPTVTDASVVLGYLDPRYFAGGAIGLDVERARGAIRDRIAEPLGLGVEDAAAGIHQVVNAQMAEGVRLVSVRQGYDPREFTLVAMGGAGPLHACALAADLAITRVVVPRHPGVLSAAGLLAAPIEHEVSVAYAEPFAGLELAPVRRLVADLDAAGRRLMEREGLSPDRDVEVLHFADVCHVGQGYHLEVPFDPGADDGLERLYADFLTAHERVHGHAVEAPARFVNLRAVHRQRMPSTPAASTAGTGTRAAGEKRAARTARAAAGEERAQGPAAGAGRSGGELSPGGRGGSGGGDTRRAVRFPDEPAPMETRIVARDALAPGERLAGPAVVEQDDTTTLVPPGWSALTGPGGIMILAPHPAAPEPADGSGIGIAPGRVGLLRLLVDGPVRDRHPLAHLDEDHPHPGPDADPLDHVRRGERPVRGDEVAGDAKRLVLGRPPLLGIEVDEEDHVGDEVAERGLDGVVDLGVGVDSPPSLPPTPSPNLGRSSTGTRWSEGSGGGRSRAPAGGGSRPRGSSGRTRGSPRPRPRW